MPQPLKFSADYEKLPPGWEGKHAWLLLVHPIPIEAQTPAFLDYDTKFRLSPERYPLPTSGPYILLVLMMAEGPSLGAVFTTLRSNRPGKWQYYKALQGEKVELVRTQNP